ncbi:amidase [Aspergillus ambiguus]|uniref:putative amidase n=1 Tax=Aspergillus ambiguus TaxID=176160 RepID=UPI003CCCEA67
MAFYRCLLATGLLLSASQSFCLGQGFISTSPCKYRPLISATADELQQGLTEGCFTSVDLVKTYVARINEVNTTLRMVLEINPDAVEIAKQLDAERKSGTLRSSLHGLPILVKDMIGTHDRMQTSAGSWALFGAQIPEDSTVIAKLRQKGLIILGKTSMSEWANLRSINSSNGWNARGGLTNAAYYPQQDPSGSSSGSAVAADLGLALAALGTETSGSILYPSEVNNVIGIKPTVGLTSRHMVIPVSQRQDSIGPIARTVKDAAMLLQDMAGPDPKDNYTLDSPFGSQIPDYAAACTLSGLQGKRIGVPQNVLDEVGNGRNPVVAAFEGALQVLRGAGATVVRDADFSAWKEFSSSSSPNMIVGLDFIYSLASFLSQLVTNPNNIYSLPDLRMYTQHDPREQYPTRDTGMWDTMLGATFNNSSPEFWRMYQENLYFGGEGGLLGALSRNKLDAVVLPTAVAASIPALIGSPVVTVPLGALPDGTPVVRNAFGDLVQAAPGIPFGISFLGARWSDEVLIGMAYAFEQRTRVRETLRRYVEPTVELGDKY